MVRIVGGFSPDEADAWQKAMTHARSQEEMMRLGVALRDRAKAKGLKGKAFQRLWSQIKGFSRYGFCHGHSLAFADHAQGTAWLLRHHPAEFLAAVLSVEPCGYWPVATVVAEAGRRGVRVLGPCVNRSPGERWRVESPSHSPCPTIRCALSYVREVGKVAEAITAEREARGSFASLADFCRRCSFLSREQMEWLALAGALDPLSASRRQTLWCLPALHVGQKHKVKRASLVGQAALEIEVPPLLPEGVPDFSQGERFSRQWQAIGFSPEGHPMQFHREALETAGVLPCAALQAVKEGEVLQVAGLVLRPHRPQNALGVVFLTLEDETGLAQVTVTPDVYDRCDGGIFGHWALVVSGVAKRRGAGIILRAEQTQRLG